jgi:hypothetical protein
MNPSPVTMSSPRTHRSTQPALARLAFFTGQWRLVASLVGSGLGLSWLADAINDGPLFQSWLWAHCWWGPACLSATWAQTAITIALALLITLLSLYALHTQIAGGKVVQLQEQTLRPHKVLIMWLSTGPGHETFSHSQKGEPQVSWRRGAETTGPFTLTHDPDADATSSGNPRWNMWQHLRAVQPHQAQLQALYMLVTAASEPRFEFAQQLHRHYLGLGEAVIRPPTPVEEHNIQAQIDQVNQLVAQIKAENPGVKDSDIMIDCTGGLKLSSIAAACATLNNPIELQYVNTDPEDLSVKTYQLVYMAPQN